MLKRLLRLIVLIVMLGVPRSAAAHNPVYAPDNTHEWETALELPDPQISWAIYGRLTDPSEIDFYRFEAQAGESLFIQMTIPVIAGLEEFEPSFALVGVGLPSDEATSPTALLSDQGIVAVADDGSPPRLFYESFSGRQYWMRQELRINAPQTGTYYVLVWHPQGEVGKYVLAVGDVEQRVADRPGVGGSQSDYFSDPYGEPVPNPKPQTLPATSVDVRAMMLELVQLVIQAITAAR